MALPQLGSHKFFFLPISATPLPQLVCHKYFWTNNNESCVICCENVVKILWTWQLFFYSFTDFVTSSSFFFFPFLAMPLPQLPKQFYFFFPFSAITLPQLPKQILFFLIFGNAIVTIAKTIFFSPYFGNGIATIRVSQIFFSPNFGNAIATISLSQIFLTNNN